MDHVYQLANGHWVVALYVPEEEVWMDGRCGSLDRAPTLEELARRGWTPQYETREEAEEAALAHVGGDSE